MEDSPGEEQPIVRKSKREHKPNKFYEQGITDLKKVNKLFYVGEC